MEAFRCCPVHLYIQDPCEYRAHREHVQRRAYLPLHAQKLSVYVFAWVTSNVQLNEEINTQSLLIRTAPSKLKIQASGILLLGVIPLILNG